MKEFSRWLERHSYSLETVLYQCQGSQQHRALLVQPKAGSKGDVAVLWVMFGGNAMLAADWFFFIERLVLLQGTRSPVAFLLVDYPGYGFNPGSPTPSAAV